MLKFLGRRRRSRKLLLFVFVGLLALGLIGAFTPWGPSTGVSDEAVVADVDGYRVTLRDLRSALAAYGQQVQAGQASGRPSSPSEIYDLYGQQILDSLIRDKVVLYEADRLNMMTTDAELKERLRQTFAPWPGPDQYRQRLLQAGTTPFEFEDNLRELIAREKLRSFVTAAVQVSQAEVENEYRRNNSKYTIRWVEVDPVKFEDKIQPTDADLLAFFETNRAEFHIATEQRRARFILIDQARASESVQVTDDEMRAEFVPERGVREVRVSQIVLNIPAPERKRNEEGKPEAENPAEETMKRAEEIIARARGGDDKAAEDFAALAREVSQDTVTRPAGGDIGWVKKDDSRPTDDPLNRVFTMQQDEISPPVRKGEKVYILKVTDRKLPTFEESREQLAKEARVRKAYSKAVEIATEVEQKFKETRNAEAVVAEINGKYGAEVTRIGETDFFSKGDTLSEPAGAFDLDSAVFNLTNVGEVTDRLFVNNGFAVAQYVERKDPHDPPFEKVRAKVEERYRKARSSELALEQASRLAQSRTPEDLRNAANSLRLKVDERAGMSGNDSVGPLVSERTRDIVYQLEPGTVAAEPIKADNFDAYVVASLVSRVDADMGEPFKNEEKSIRERLLSSRRETFFSTYLATIQKRLSDQGRIKINQNVIDRALPPTAESSLGPQRPGAPLAPGRRGQPPAGQSR